MVSECNLYRYALNRDDLSINARVLWCYLCTQVSLDVHSAGLKLSEVLAERDEAVYLENVSYVNIPSKLRLSRHRYREAMSELFEKRYYVLDRLYFPMQMLDGGFFKLRSEEGMTPWDYVLYSWLLDRIEYGGGNMTDVTNASIAAGLGVGEASVKKWKGVLYANGWLKAVRYGKMVYCADPVAMEKDGGPRPPKVPSRGVKPMRLNLERF